MFVYCANNPLIYADAQGEDYELVGAGIQLEITCGDAVVGVEVICYWDVKECINGAPVVAVYAYSGISVNADDAVFCSILATITDNSSLLSGGTEAGVLAMASLLSETFSVDVSGVLVFGNSEFISTDSYENSFTSIGGTIGKAKGSVAYSESAYAVSVGYNIVGTNALANCGVSKTYYTKIAEINLGRNLAKNKSGRNVMGGGRGCIRAARL